MRKFLENKSIYKGYVFVLNLIFISLPFPSPAITNLLIVLAIAMVLYKTYKEKRFSVSKNEKMFFILIVFFVLSSLIPTYIYDHTVLSNYSTRPFYFIIIPFVILLGPSIKDEVEKIKENFVIAVVVFSLVGFAKMVYLYELNVENKLFFDSFSNALKIHTTSYAYLTVIAVSISLYRILLKPLSSIKKLLWIVILLYLLGVVFFLSTRIALLALTLVFITVCIYSYIKTNNKRSFAYLVIGFIITAVSMSSGYFSERVENLFAKNIENKSDIENRFVIWDCAIETYKKNDYPIVGLGLENSNSMLLECYADKNFFGSSLGYHAHNQYLQILISSGVLGLLVFTLFVIYIYYKAYINKNLFLGLTTTIFCIFFLTESVFELQLGVTTFILFVSLFFKYQIK